VRSGEVPKYPGGPRSPAGMPIESNRRHFGWIKKSFAVELIKGFFFQFSAFFCLNDGRG